MRRPQAAPHALGAPHDRHLPEVPPALPRRPSRGVRGVLPPLRGVREGARELRAHGGHEARQDAALPRAPSRQGAPRRRRPGACRRPRLRRRRRALLPRIQEGRLLPPRGPRLDARRVGRPLRREGRLPEDQGAPVLPRPVTLHERRGGAGARVYRRLDGGGEARHAGVQPVRLLRHAVRRRREARARRHRLGRAQDKTGAGQDGPAARAALDRGGRAAPGRLSQEREAGVGRPPRAAHDACAPHPLQRGLRPVRLRQEGDRAGGHRPGRQEARAPCAAALAGVGHARRGASPCPRSAPCSGTRARRPPRSTSR